MTNYYATRFTDAWDAARKISRQLPDLEARTVAFVRSIVDADLPAAVKEGALYNVSTLRSQTCFRSAEGHLYGWEGYHPESGCCSGSCTHVWNYEQTTAFLFGDLARSMRDVEFGYSTNDSGLMNFRTDMPSQCEPTETLAAADGQMGCLLKLYRDWQLCGDDDFLRRLWPAAKRSLAFAWIPGSWDADMDGVMEGCQHNTMDVEYYGPNGQMQGWYLGALRAAEEMARYLGEASFADTCRDLFTKGSAWMDANLFNGEYYEHHILPPAGDLCEGLRHASMGARDPSKPDFQLGTACLVDQLVGQYFAHVVGLGYLHDPAKIKTTLKSLMRYNFLEDFSGHFNNMRSYVLGEESAMLMATYPHGERPKFPFPYFNEVMTGFEYTAAVGMLQEGATDDGLRVISAIRERYDGRKRNPFDEAECGHHYARAMAAWAAILAITDFHYSAVTGDMSFAAPDRVTTWPWSTGAAWGSITIRPAKTKTRAVLTVLGGSVTVDSIHIGDRTHHLPTSRTIAAGETLDVTATDSP